VIVLDTTVLLYALGGEHPLREPSRRLVDAIGAGRVQATTTVEVIQEFVHVRARRVPRRDAGTAGRFFAALLSPLLVVGVETVEDGLRTFEKHASLGAFDAFLAASAISSKAEALVSADRSFAAVPRLRHVAPGTPAFERLLDR
jgi:predicted nucleic acid-binding protein